MGAARTKGTAAETAVAGYLARNGWPHAERRALFGSVDRGDITGTPGLCWEIKAGARLDIPGWLRQLETETVNARAANGFLVVKPRGVGEANVHRWWTIAPLHQVVGLLREAGFGDARG